MHRIALIKKVICNDRINEYESIIALAKENNYEIISLRRYAQSEYDPSKNVLVLRHDIDSINKGTEMMFEIEKKYGVFSSFYFRNSTFTPVLMKEIEKYGSESSLHFETIADYLKANPDIQTKEMLYKTDFQDRCLKLLKFDIEKFRILLDIPCLTIASHGDSINRLFDIPSNVLTENSEAYKYLGIQLEAYDSVFLEKACYISDCPIDLNYGYRYKTTPVTAIKNKEKLIVFLTHPEHWYLQYFDIIYKTLKILIKGSTERIDTFRRI